MEIFNVHKKEIDQVKKKIELRSTNPLKVNKRKRKQKDIIIKLIDNLPNHLKDKKDYFLQTYLLFVLSVGNMDTMLWNVENKKKLRKRKKKLRKKKIRKERKKKKHDYTDKSSYKYEFLNIIDRMIFQKQYTEIALVVHK